MTYLSSQDQARVAEINAKGACAYVSFDKFDRAFCVAEYGPGSWAVVTIVYAPDGTTSRY